MDDNKTLTHLYSTGKNRFAKVVFIAVFLIVLLFWNVIIFSISKDWVWGRSLLDGYYVFNFWSYIKFFFIGNFIIFTIFEVIKRSFYYIVLGTIKPAK